MPTLTGRRLRVPLLLLALMLAGCGDPPPASAPILTEVVGPYLPGALGAAIEDQNRIDLTMAGLCATATYSESVCDQHDARSAERRRALRAVTPGV